uniref:CCHC-type domain-containing protein n=1 Tax=Trichogramma kaykai TaxID=54128 RepID=A0ABD2W0M5_9HYME
MRPVIVKSLKNHRSVTIQNFWLSAPVINCHAHLLKHRHQQTPPVQPNPTDNNNIPLQNPNPIIELDEMAEKINYDILLKIVPEFNGYNIPLSIFLKGVNEAFSMVSATQKATLLLLIRSRLTGEAANSIYDMTFTTLDEFKKHFKDYFSSAVEPYQLRARLGTEYQREDERVMTFANRLKELVRRITEAENITAQADVKALEEIAVECFKKGLKESIERKLIDATNIKDIVKNAIAAERSLQARQILRSKDIKQTTHINTVSCQLCNEQNHTADKCPSRLLTCKACKRGGHDLTNCPIMEDETCQLCHKNGHIAKFCKKNEPIKCQICEKTGHSASECNSKNNSKQSEIKCNNCKRIGHKASKCRIDTSKKCNTCNNLGHVDADCFRNKPKNANKNPTPKAENQQSQDFHFKTLKIDVEPNPCFAPLVKYKSFTFLLDTGSQVNLIKNNEFIQNIYDTNKRIEIRGLTSKKITVSGKVKYFISNRWIEFFVVPADTNITHTGIIGTQFFLSNQICLDFSTNAILNSKNIINNKTYGETYEKRKRLCEATDELFYVDILSEQSKHLQGQFLIDTGSEANIVASHLIPQHCKIDYSETFQLKGINNDTVSTIGTIYANFLCEKDVKFLVVPEFCGLPCEGIIGAKFFRQAKAILDFKNKKLITKNVDISFKPRKDVPVGNILMQDNLSANELIDSLISFHNVHAVVSPKIEPIIDEIQESSLTDLKDQESILFPEDDISYAELHLMKNAYDETYEQLDIPLEQNQVFSINSSKLDNRLSKLYDMKWRFKLAEYQYEVKYKVGKLNTAADALSRNPVEVNIITRAQQKILNEKMKETESTEEKVPSKPIPENPDKEIELPPPAPQPPAYVAQQEQDKSVLNNDTSDESDDESEHEIEISNTGVILAECKDAIESRRNIVVYFSDSNGKPLDTGGQRLLENNKISGDLKISTGDIAVNSKNYFALCIKDTNSISQEILIKHIETCFSSLKNKLTSLKASNFSIAKSKTIEDIEWNFCVGDYVFLQKNAKKGKFDDDYTGPHEILEVIGDTNLKIKINDKIQKIVHCNRVKHSHILA